MLSDVSQQLKQAQKKYQKYTLKDSLSYPFDPS